MRKGFVLKTIFMVIMLAGVLAVIVAVMLLLSGGRVPAAGSVGGGRAEGQTLFEQFVVAGGPIVWFVLLPMSVVMVYLAVEHGLTIRRKRLFPGGIGRRIIEMMRRSGCEGLAAQIADRNDFVSVAIVRGSRPGQR